VRLCRLQGAEGNLHVPGTSFDVKRHVILAELLARRHFLDKSPASRGVLKSLLHLLRYLHARGFIEQETFGGETSSPAGRPAPVRRELPDAVARRRLEATGRLGRRTPLPRPSDLRRLLTRLVSTIRLLDETAREPEAAPPPPERRVFSRASRRSSTTPSRAVNPAAGR
jgi:hypothetical protein